ncbi:MAG: NAD(P)/FAD-dependent oxidoreductase [Moraxellaceae bacterium]
MALLSRRFLARGPRHRIVILGGNFAGLSAARAFSSSTAHITLIDRSPDAEWLPNVHELLSRRKTAEQLKSGRQALLQAWGHNFLQTEVATLECAQQRLVTTTGERLDYDLLLLASGSRAHDHGIPGVAEHALHPRSVTQGLRISNALTRLAALPAGRDVVIVGGGLEGLEMLGEILQRFGREGRLNLHLVEQETKLFPRFPGLHERLLEQMRGEVQIHSGHRIAAVHADSVQLDDGRLLPSRLTIWSAGRRGQELASRAGLATNGDDVAVHSSLQSRSDAHVFVAGDAAALPRALDKQAHYAQAMGAHAAANMQRLLQGQPLQDFRPLHKPSLLAFGDRDGVMFFEQQALASPALIALKEGLYQYGMRSWQPQGRGLLRMASRLQRGMSELDLWGLLLKSRDSQLFTQR